MNRRHFTLAGLAGLLLLGGCEMKAHIESKPAESAKSDPGAFCPWCNRDWRFMGKPTGLGPEWDYVCVTSGRLDDAQITQEEKGKPFKLWVRGANGGEYATLDAAKAQAQLHVRNREWTCP